MCQKGKIVLGWEAPDCLEKADIHLGKYIYFVLTVQLMKRHGPIRIFCPFCLLQNCPISVYLGKYQLVAPLADEMAVKTHS